MKFYSIPVFLKVGGITPKGAILMGRGQKNKGAIGGRKNTKGAKVLND